MADLPNEVGIELDGERYSIPTLDTITLDEERVFYIYADVVVSDFLPAHPDWAEEEARAHLMLQAHKIRNPDFKRALVHVAYKRRHPEVESEEIDRLIGGASALDLDLELIRGAAAADPQTSSPNELEKTSEPSPLARSGDSGPPTGKSSGTPDSSLEATGISGSDTSSPESLRIASGS